MTSLPEHIKRRAAWRSVGLACVALVVTSRPAHAAGGALDLLYERTVMSAADQRCALSTPQIKAALDASRLQARGAALRAGTPKDRLAETEGRAWRKARAV